MTRWSVVAIVVMCLGARVLGDCYMHNPRGSNNRLNGNNENRDTNNRLFDSQNNAKGGYCWGPKMYYYVGSLLSVEWTVQHECGATSDKVDCDIILQYMCAPPGTDESVGPRDGTTEQQITTDPANFNVQDSNGAFVYGMHEDFTYYSNCKTRARNGGLFTADQTVNTQTALGTRQNPNGGTSGLECPEERDYYPYWHPSPWKDVAIITSRTSLCSWMQANSQNVQAKGNCSDPRFGDAASCTGGGGTFNMVPAWGLPAPECIPAPFSRDNHLGNGLTGYPNVYNWTIPNYPSPRCVLRIRYNVTTRDGTVPYAQLTSANNNGNSPVKQNPYYPFLGLYYRLAINTAQFGRTFQDRSHVFEIRKRPSGVDGGARIYNLNVRGKRGNIVQVYPAVEYDFVPNILQLRSGDYVHFQWTGCDNNPQGNDGEGRTKTDRSNVVPLSRALGTSIHVDAWNSASPSFSDATVPKFWSTSQANLMASLGQTGCLNVTDLQARNVGTNGQPDQNQVNQDLQNCAKLNAADRYFDGGLVQINGAGVFRYMSSRNNNFSNRGQKATIVVVPLVQTFGVVLLSLSAAAFAAAVVIAIVVKFMPGSGLAAAAVGV